MLMSAALKPTNAMTRWGLLFVVVLLGGGLVASAVVHFAGARRLGTTLARGQAEAFFASVRQSFRSERPSDATMAAVLAEHASSGLRYIAIVHGDEVVAEAGTSSGTLTRLPRDGELQHVGDRVRMAGPPPAPRGHSRPPRGPPGERRLKRPAKRPRALGPPQLVVEFDPLESKQLVARARMHLGLAVAATLLLILVAFVFVRQQARAQAAAALVDRQHHLAALGELSAVLAHEIRNPLAALKGHAQLLVELAGDEASERRAGRVVKEALRLELLTNSLLDFARSGRVDAEPLDPRSVVVSAVEATVPERVDVDVSGAPERWSLDGIRVGQVIENLVRNALQAAPEERVDVRLFQRGDTLSLEVEDRGPGVPAEDREQVFEPFQTKKLHGTGLGLAVARRIVELHGGMIEVEAGPDGGALFRVSFPA